MKCLYKLVIVLFSLIFISTAEAKVVKVAAVAAPSVYLDTKQSTDDVVNWIKKADKENIRIISFPEGFIGGYPLWNYVEQTIKVALGEKNKADFFSKGAVDIDGPEIARIAAAAKKHDVGVVLGVNLRGEGSNRHNVFNATVFIDENGKIMNVHRKTAASHTERQYWTYGDADSIKNVTIQGIEVTAVMCWEARNPFTVTQLALAAPDVIFLPSGDFYHKEANGLYLVEMRYIGRNTHAYVASSTMMFDWKVLEDNHPELTKLWKAAIPPTPMLGLGGGAAVDPHGNVMDITKPFESRFVSIDVDTDKIRASMQLHSITDSYRLKGDYTLYVNGKKASGNGPAKIY